jgi:hypothetical protein
MMMHGVASTNTAPTTTTTTTTTNSTNMLQQDGSVVSTTSVTTTAQTGFKQDSINFSIKLKDPQSSMSLFSDAHQRKLEMLESRFVPLNPQKVYTQ